MNSDLDRFLRAVRKLCRLVDKYTQEAFAEALGRYASVKQEGEVWFVGTFLDDIGTILSNRRGDWDGQHCRQCGKRIHDNARYNDRDARPDVRYCSPRCRQRAYRGRRVTDSTLKCAPKRNGRSISLRLGPQKQQQAVTAAAPPFDYPDLPACLRRPAP